MNFQFLTSFLEDEALRYKLDELSSRVLIAEEKSDFINWLNGSRALIRTIDVNASHLAHGDGRTTIYEHIASIQCRLRTDNMELKKLYYILIDDIITTGTTMDACEKILSRVVPKENIIRLAIGRTI